MLCKTLCVKTQGYLQLSGTQLHVPEGLRR